MGSRYIYKKVRNFHQECGSGLIFNLNLVPDLDNIRFDQQFRRYEFIVNHEYLKEKLLNNSNSTCIEIPFEAVVHNVHDNNMVARRHRLSPVRILKNILFMRLLTDEIKEEFSFENIAV